MSKKRTTFAQDEKQGISGLKRGKPQSRKQGTKNLGIVEAK